MIIGICNSNVYILCTLFNSSFSEEHYARDEQKKTVSLVHSLMHLGIRGFSSDTAVDCIINTPTTLLQRTNMNPAPGPKQMPKSSAL